MHLKRFERAPRRMRRHKSLEVFNRGDQILQVKVAQPRPIFSIGEMFENVGHRIQSRGCYQIDRENIDPGEILPDWEDSLALREGRDQHSPSSVVHSRMPRHCGALNM